MQPRPCRAGVEKKLKAAKEKVEMLKRQLEEEDEKVESLAKELEECKDDPKEAQNLEEAFKDEVEDLQRLLGNDTADKEGEEEAQPPTGSTKRKRRTEKSSGRAKKQAKPDMGALYLEGRDLCRKDVRGIKGSHLRGRMMIEAAADAGVACAEATCIYRGWGGHKEDIKDAQKRFQELAEDPDGEHQAIAKGYVRVIKVMSTGYVHYPGPRGWVQVRPKPTLWVP